MSARSTSVVPRSSAAVTKTKRSDIRIGSPCLTTVLVPPHPDDLLRLLKIVGVHRDEVLPLLRRLVERVNRFNGTRRHARATVDAFIGVNVEHLRRLKLRLVLPGMDAVDGTDI